MLGSGGIYIEPEEGKTERMGQSGTRNEGEKFPGQLGVSKQDSVHSNTHYDIHGDTMNKVIFSVNGKTRGPYIKNKAIPVRKQHITAYRRIGCKAPGILKLGTT
jgi:hypothetical protein